MSDPLAGASMLPAIDVVIPCHLKDSGTVSLAVTGTRSSIRNPIREVRIVADPAGVDGSSSLVPEASVTSDRDLWVRS